MINLCIVNSNYSLLLYLLYIGKEEIDRTLFVLGYDVSPHVRNGIKYKLVLPRVSKNNIFSYVWLAGYYLVTNLIIKPLIYFFKVKTFGNDQYYFSNLLSNRYILIEEGLENYQVKQSSFNPLIKRLVLLNGFLGFNNKCGKIILTGIKETPKIIKSKTEVVSLMTLWADCSYKDFILELFKANYTANENYFSYSLIITQPFIQDFKIKLCQQNALYKNIIKKYDLKKIVLKKHPRDNMHYDFEKDCQLINKDVPLELLSLIGFEFKSAYTFYSSAIYKVNTKEKIIIGTGGLQKLNPKFPLVKSYKFNY